MTLQDIKEHFGVERYEAASAGINRTLSGPGWTSRAGDVSADLAHDIGSLLVYDLEAEGFGYVSDMDKISLLFEAYEDLPCYALLMYPKQVWDKLSLSVRLYFWEHTREILSSKHDIQADAIVYSLAVDFFEDPETVDEAWDALIAKHAPSNRLLERILGGATSAVPYTMKRELYSQLIRDERWYPYIYRSLLHSAFSAYGSIDKQDARKLLERLELPEDTEHLNKLREKLASS